MATQPVSGASKPVYPNANFPDEVDPSDRQTIYAMICKGKCLEPVFADGEGVAFSKDADIQPGDYVGICLVPDAVQPNEPPSRVKRLRSMMPGLTFPYPAAASSEIMPLVELEQHNPARVLRVPADRILAMHKVIGTAIITGKGSGHVVPLEPERLDRLEHVLVQCVR